jgi:hypothetical protein
MLRGPYLTALALAVGPTVTAAPSLSWREAPGYRARPVQPASGARAVGFTLLPPAQTGVTFTNRLDPARSVTNQIYFNGSGVAAGDADGDGCCDLYFCGLDAPNALYRNQGDWRFEDIAARAGVDCPGLDCTGAAFADLDGDADLDLAVNTIGAGTRVFLNDGRGSFTPHATLNPGRAGHSLALADVDGDGDLDLYVANYRATTLRDMPGTKFRVNVVDGRPVITHVNDRPVTEPDLEGRYSVDAQGRVTEFGEPDAFYLNDGRADFMVVSWTGGAFLDEDGRPLSRPPYDWSLSVLLRDFNGDGAPDLYTCSDFSPPDRFWLNDGRGRFRLAPRLALRTTSMFSMGLDVADVNRDGLDDVFVSDMLSRSHLRRMVQVGDLVPVVLEVGRVDDRPQYLRNVLQLNRGDGTYAELGRFACVAASEWTWCPVFVDVDLDGYEDLLVTTGHERDAMNGDIADQVRAARLRQDMSRRQMLELGRLFPPLATPNVAFRNRGDLTFEEVSEAWGYATPGVSQGQALADLDNDGDPDLAINNLNGVAGLYRNETTAPRLAVRLRGRPPNTGGIGARLAVEGGPVRQTQEMIAGGHYLSASELQRVFAAGRATNRLRLEVTWRSGARSMVTNVPANHVIEVDEAAANSSAQASPDTSAPPPPLFADASDRLGHRHEENTFDDFARQPLLPRKLSQLGPGATWADVNGDGADDLILASGNGGTLALYLNDGRGGFTRSRPPPVHHAVTRDQTTVLAWPRGPGDVVLVAGSANYEDALEIGPVARQYELATGRMDDSLPPAAWSAGALALADVDADGDLDLLVAGRCTGERYPEPASAWLFRQENGRWVRDEAASRLLERVGLVTGALFSDLTGDGWPELVLACEWGPVRLFRNDHGQLVGWDPPLRGGPPDAPPAASLGDLTGWWQGVAAGDLDGDGRLDLVVANWGWNTFHRPSPAHPLRLYFGDFDDNGTLDLIEAAWNEELGREVPLRGLQTLRAALPFLADVTPTYERYGRSGVRDLLGERYERAGRLEARTLASLVLLNRGDHFEARPLPPEAQWAPAFGVCVADFDGDGAEDLFLSQNFFAVPPDHWRYDAGRGLLLRGDGRGGLAPMPGQASGLAVYGEQRGCAVADFDGDGRADLVVTQNGNQTRLFRNVGARPGLRVRLQGPPGNRPGIGAVVRARWGERLGPAREIRAGSGWWSQDSAMPVLATPAAASAIQVRWPGGRETTAAVPAGAREVTVAAELP